MRPIPTILGTFVQCDECQGYTEEYYLIQGTFLTNRGFENEKKLCKACFEKFRNDHKILEKTTIRKEETTLRREIV